MNRQMTAERVRPLWESEGTRAAANVAKVAPPPSSV
jgi:hypothetical protein